MRSRISFSGVAVSAGVLAALLLIIVPRLQEGWRGVDEVEAAEARIGTTVLTRFFDTDLEETRTEVAHVLERQGYEPVVGAVLRDDAVYTRSDGTALAVQVRRSDEGRTEVRVAAGSGPGVSVAGFSERTLSDERYAVVCGEFFTALVARLED